MTTTLPTALQPVVKQPGSGCSELSDTVLSWHWAGSKSITARAPGDGELASTQPLQRDCAVVAWFTQCVPSAKAGLCPGPSQQIACPKKTPGHNLHGHHQCTKMNLPKGYGAPQVPQHKPPVPPVMTKPGFPTTRPSKGAGTALLWQEGQCHGPTVQLEPQQSCHPFQTVLHSCAQLAAGSSAIIWSTSSTTLLGGITRTSLEHGNNFSPVLRDELLSPGSGNFSRVGQGLFWGCHNLPGPDDQPGRLLAWHQVLPWGRRQPPAQGSSCSRQNSSG